MHDSGRDRCLTTDVVSAFVRLHGATSRAKLGGSNYDPGTMPTTLDLARRLLAIAQTGLHYSPEEFDRERYREVADIAAQLLAAQSQHSVEELKRAWLFDKGYCTPKLDVRGAVFRDDGKVLLVRERSDGKWTLPGGWAEVNDPPSVAVQKEIEQESGFTARAVKLAAVYDRNRHVDQQQLFHSWKCFFICEITGGEVRTSYETSGVDFFSIDALPELSSDRANEQQIRRMYEHHLKREMGADFD